MTSLTAVAASFFSRGVGCVTGQSGPQDVARGMFVGVGKLPAPLTSEHRLGDAVLFGCVLAGFARSEVWRGSTSITVRQRLPLWRQNRDELPLARIGDTSVQPGLGRCTVGQEGRDCRGRERVWPGAPWWRSPSPPPRSGHRSAPVCGRFCGGSRAGSWRPCGVERPPSHVGGAGCSTPAGRGPAAAGRRPAGRGGASPARVGHVIAVGGGGETGDPDINTALAAGVAAAWAPRRRRRGSASSAGPRAGSGSFSPAPARRGARSFTWPTPCR